MAGLIGFHAFLLLSCVILAESLTTVLVYDGDSDNSTIQSCLDVLKSGGVAVRPYRVNMVESLESIRADVCTRMAETDDLAMILDYSRLQAVNSLLDGLSQQLHVPHLRMGSAFQPEFGRHDFQLQVYPGAVLQLLLLKDFLRKERKEGRWQAGAVVLPTKSSDLHNLATLMQNVQQPLVIRKWTNVMEENNQMFEEVAKSSVKNFIVGLAPEQLNEFFVLMSSKRMLTFVHRYLLVHPGAFNADLSTFAYSGADIVAFRPELGSGSSLMLTKLTEIAKDLAAPLKSSPPSNWRPRCSGEAWRDGRRAMDAILGKTEASHGLLRSGADLTCPAVDFQFSVDELTTTGFAEMFTWRNNGGFRMVESQLRRKRQASRRNLRVTTLVDRPFVMYDKATNQYKGLVIDILNEIGRQLNVDFTITQVKDGYYGQQQSDGEWNGMIGEVIGKKADVAVAAISITYERERVVDFSTPFTTVGLVPLFTKSDLQSFKWTAFCVPFTSQVWVFIIVALVITSLVLFVTARLSPDEWHHSNPTTKVNQFTLANCFWFVAGAALFRGTNLSPRATGPRLVSLAWWFFILLLVIAYAVSIQSFLTLDRTEAPIRNVEDLARQTEVKYGVLYGGSSYAFFKQSTFPTYQKMFDFMTKENSFVSSSRMGVKRVLYGNYAYFMESILAEYYAARNCQLRVLGPRLNTKGYGFAFPKDSPYRDSFSMAILKLQQNQVVEALIRKWIYKDGIKQPCSDEPGPVAMGSYDHYNLAGLFIGLVIGLAIALAICILEVLFRACLPKCRGERSCFGYLGHRLRLLFCACNGKDVHEKTDSGTELS